MFTLAIANQKGGVTKTTSTVSLSAALARAGKRVLMVDLDPQASLTEYFVDPTKLKETMYEVIVRGKKITPIVLGARVQLLPTNIDFAAAEIELPAKVGFERSLKRFLRPYAPDYDYCILDCPPSLGVFTRNALTAADTVLIPVACEEMARRTITLMLNHIVEVREGELNSALYPWYILPTLYSAREKEDNDVLESIRDEYAQLVYGTPVPRRTDYKKAVRQHVDVSDVDAALGDLWDQLACELMAESETILKRSAARE